MKMLIALIFLTIVAIFMLSCYVGFRMACIRGRGTTYDFANLPRNHPLIPYADMLLETSRKNAELKFETITIETFDGLKLYADYYPLEGSNKTIILMHGYRSAAKNDFCLSIKYYLDLGFNVLLPDQRCHSRSEGRYITYGIREKYDCRDWILKVIEMSGEDIEIVLGGMSMGASTVLLASGLDLPPNVKAITADSGFTSGYDIVKNTAKAMNRHIPSFLIDIINFMCRIFGDFDLKEGNTLEAMQKTKIPIFFVHGTRDTFVPCEMTLRNYATCHAEKELLTVVGAEHGLSFLLDREKYTKVLEAFLQKYTS